MKISDSIETTSGLHVFETPEDLIINSQVYDKFSMDPKPYNFFNIQTLANKNLLLHEINILEYTWVNPSKEPDYKYYIQDNQDSSIFYCLLEIGNADPNQYFHKIQKVDNNYELIKSVTPDSSYAGSSGYQMSTHFHYKIIGQTNDKILLVQETLKGTLTQYITGFSYGGWYVGAQSAISYSAVSYIVINKTDLSSKIINISGDNNYDNGIYFIKNDDFGIYTLECISGAISICYINLNNATRKEMYKNNNYSGNGSIGISNVIKFQNFYYTMVGAGSRPIDGRKFLRFQIDEILKTCINISIENIDSTLFESFYKNGSGDLDGDSWIRYSLSNIENKYIQITSHNNQNKGNGKQYISGFYKPTGYTNLSRYSYFVAVDYTLAVNGKHRHFLCKKNNNQWTIANVITPSDSQQFIYGVLYLDQYTPIFHLNTGIEIHRFNPETETYTKVFEASGTFQTIGLDENNNFYTFDINNKCDIYNRNSCSTLNGRFEYDTYNYDNEDIETNVTIASKNFIGELIASKIHIELSGNCKFRNGKQEATLNTRLDLEYEVPVIITGPGVVYCNINEVE